MSRKVELDIVLDLVRIFNEKGWNSIDGYEEVLRKFCELTDNFDSEQSKLIVELTERYRWLTYNDYHNLLRKLLNSLYDKIVNQKEKLYIFPIIKPDDEDDVKSGHAVMYFIKSIKPMLSKYQNINFELLHKFEDLEAKNLDLQDNEHLVLVDDYIGSGGTLNSALEEVDKNDSLKDRFSVLTVAIQEEAKEMCDKLNIPIFCGEVMKKGISQFYGTSELTGKLSVMESIENNIPKVKNYRLGYEESQALITLIRTPNNTFPIFWKDYSRRGKIYKAPFPRF